VIHRSTKRGRQTKIAVIGSRLARFSFAGESLDRRVTLRLLGRHEQAFEIFVESPRQ
jgi:hypothetical protein